MILFLKHYWKSIFISILIFYVSIIHIPSNVSMPFPQFDKLVHVLMYFALAAGLTMDNFRFFFSLKKSLVFSIIIPTVYGGLIEILQENFFPPRSGNWADFSADLVGAILGFYISQWALRKLFSSHF